jgi:deoxyribodipyrimidine photo-lyase
LAWRDYWQQVWIAKGDDINTDLKNTQEPVSNYQVPEAVANASTGIEAVDNAIQELYDTGYMHNHMRMYVASICCNVAHSHWLEPARWLYAHLLDGDLASNQLSWQWVAGAFSSKKYYANQGNINKFFNSSQQNTFLDIDYSEFSNLKTPEILMHTSPFDLQAPLPDIERPALQQAKTTLIYNYYNLDPSWHEGEDVQRVLLLEPSAFRKNPVNQKCVDFVMRLKQNIPEMQVFVGEFSELVDQLHPEKIIYKEHPLNKHYQGQEEPRDWMSKVSGYFPSFFAFWKKCKKEIRPQG